MRGGHSAGEGLALARGTWGTLLLLAPGAVGRLYAGRPPDRLSVGVLRVLGARQVVQAALTARPGRRALAAGAAVDLTHAASMVGLALVDRQRRRAGLADAGVATALALVGLGLYRAQGQGEVDAPSGLLG